MFGFYNIATASPALKLANPQYNATEIIKLAKEANSKDCSIILFGELSLIGYSIGDLLFQSSLLNSQDIALQSILEESKNIDITLVIGVALKYFNRLYNCAIVIKDGEILGAIPKSYIPNKQEFYEARHFNSGKDIVKEQIDILGKSVPFGVDLLFSNSSSMLFGIEICEDLWAVTPPSNHMVSNGANLILNLSASNEIVGKSDYRLELVKTQSSRAICAYAYASSSIGESGSDTIFSGDLIVTEYGRVLNRDNSFNFNSKMLTTTIDLQRVSNIRYLDTSFNQSRKKGVRVITLNIKEATIINREYNSSPFVPKGGSEQELRALEITNIQAYALLRRMKQANIKRAIIGISGGLDSTLALLSTHKAFKIANWDYKDIICYTMPGFGTTSRTYNNAIDLCNKLGVTLKEVDIKDISKLEFNAIEHDINEHSVTYENVQARARTSILMNSANKLNALVIGTGDLSEIALGWSTYNGDHMSMYGLNSGIPKTLIKYLIEYYAKDELKDVLKDILSTPVSPELLPNSNDKITQVTEDIVGPYELHDFFLYHFIREGFTPKKILYIASIAFKDSYNEDTIKKWLKLFIKRFFTQQFKRNCMPDGIMVGTISLSPRANWRMPSDADFTSFLQELE
jgi:NAD+ synthase (glutamine-hydrolysing)